MSVLTMFPETPIDVETPPAGFGRIYISNVDYNVYLKKSDGTTLPIGGVGGTALSSGLSLLDVIDDVGSVGSPAAGDKYLIGSSPVGILTGNTDNIAVYDGAAWAVEIMPNNTIYDIISGVQAGTYHNVGVFPTNTITPVILSSNIIDHQLTSADATIEDAFNAGAAVVIASTDRVYITWTRTGLTDVYAWAGLTDGTDWGSGGTGTAVASDFIRLTAMTVEFETSTFRILDDVDVTKKVAFDASAIGSGTLRTITIPDANVDLSKINQAVLKDGTTPFVAAQIGVDATNPTELATLQQVIAIHGTANAYFGEILSGDIDGTYVPSGTEKRYIVVHNLALADKANFV